MKKKPFSLDERQRQIVYRIIMALYFFTLVYLGSTIFYREHILGQPSTAFDDIAILFTINVLGLGIAILWTGGIVIEKFRWGVILSIYIGWVVLGTLYTVIVRQITDWKVILNKIGIISALCGIIILVYLLIAFIPRRRIDSHLD